MMNDRMKIKTAKLSTDATVIIGNLVDCLSDLGQYNVVPMQRQVELAVTNGVGYTPWQPVSKEGTEEDYFRFREERSVIGKHQKDMSQPSIAMAADLTKQKDAIRHKMYTLHQLVV
jgi:hypothetical protein